jgi:uncharacterized protein
MVIKLCKDGHAAIRSAGRLTLVAVLATIQPAFAVGFDCSRAANATETAVCTHDDLQRADNRLASAYRQLLTAAPGQRASLRKTQREWLATRNRCGSDTGCIETQYEQRTNALEKQLHDQLAYRPDDIDRAALDDLRQAVDAAKATEREFALGKVLDRFKIRTGTTSFSGEDQARGVQPSGVTADEWRAFLASGIKNHGENGMVTYTLMDIDGDHQRDLVIDTYSGGTGLYTYTSVLRRQGNQFVDPHAVPPPQAIAQAASSDKDNDTDDADDLPMLYSINGRGANQDAVWIRLRGRVYAAWRDSAYDEDDVYLIRPLTVPGDLPKLTVSHRYQSFSLKGEEAGNDSNAVKPVDRAWSAGITAALAEVSRDDAALTAVKRDDAKTSGGQQEPLCPVPAGVTGDDRLGYYGFGAAGYTEEVIDDLPVWVGRQCYVGRLFDRFNVYGQSGLAMELAVHKPLGDDTERSFMVVGKRSIVRVETSVAPIQNSSD